MGHTETKYISTPDTAKAIREALKQAFPKTKFSVRSKSYSMGSSISVYWTDGPTTKQVNPILKAFEGAGFDGMQDMKTSLGPSVYKGEVIRWGVDYVFSQRSESFETLKQAAMLVAVECNLPLLKIALPDYSKSFYSSTHVEGGNYGTDWHFRSDFASESQNGFSCDPRHVCLPTDSHSELIYQVARSISQEETQPYEVPSRVTQEFIDATVKGMVA